MKIAFLTPEYPHSKIGSSGGIGTSIKNLAESLTVLGHTVRILVYAQKEDAYFKDNDIEVQLIQNVKFKGLSWFITRKKIEKIIDDLFEKSLVDIVEAPDWTGITSFIQPEKCPIVIRLHGSDTYFCHLDNRPVKFLNKFHEKRALQKANGHISVSQYTADMTNQLFGLQLPFTIIPNGITTKQFESNASNESTEKTILYFGTLIRKKGLLELPLIFNEVVSKFSNVKLVLVGRDASDKISGNVSTWSMMESLFSSEAKSKVQYLGGVPYDEVQKYIEEATVCVFPSFAEALPVSWLEAMAMKKAIVASDIGWSKEVVEDTKEGFLVNPKEHKKYAERIITFLNNDNVRSELSESAFKKVKSTFESSILINKNLNFYQQIVAKK